MTRDKSHPNHSGCPMMKTFSKTDLSYNDYLRIPELTQLQTPQSSPPHHDELLFIIIHQAYELWFKLILHEFEHAIQSMQKADVPRAQHFVHRTVQIMKLLVQQIHILETMSPSDFLAFRDALTPASGFQSSQFREIEFVAGLKDESLLRFFKNRPDYLERLHARLKEPDLKSSFFEMLPQLGFNVPKNVTEQTWVDLLLPVYRSPSEHFPLYLLCEALLEFDEHLGLWREHHIRVVERVIGTRPGTGGSEGAQYLRTTTSKRCFSFLWNLRGHLH